MIWLLANWKLAAVAIAFTILAGTASLFHVERDRARAALEIAELNLAAMDAAGKAQAKATDAANLEAAEITRRATDALVSQLADARDRGDAVARRLRVLAAAGHDCSLPGVTVTAPGASGTPGGASGEGVTADPLTGYTRACEADSARLAGWQDWWRDQARARP
jgi:hypothetical protein